MGRHRVASCVTRDHSEQLKKPCILIVLVNITYAGRRFDVRD